MNFFSSFSVNYFLVRHLGYGTNDALVISEDGEKNSVWYLIYRTMRRTCREWVMVRAEENVSVTKTGEIVEGWTK